MGTPLTKISYASTDPFQNVAAPFENYNPAGMSYNPPQAGCRQANVYYSERPSAMNYPPGQMDYGQQDLDPSFGYPSRYQDGGQSGPIPNPGRFRPSDSGFMDDFLSGPMSGGQGMDCPQQRGPPQRRRGYQSAGQPGPQAAPQGRVERMDDGFWDDDPVYLPDGGFGNGMLDAMRQRVAPAQPAQMYRCAPARCAPQPRANVVTSTSYVQEPRGFCPPAGAYVVQGGAPVPTPQPNQQQATIVYYDPKTGGVVGSTGAQQPQMPQILNMPQSMMSQQMVPGMMSMPTQQPQQVISYQTGAGQQSYPSGGGAPMLAYQQPQFRRYQ